MGKTKIKIIDDSVQETIDDRKSKVVVEDRKIEDGEEINLPSSTIKEPSSTPDHPSSQEKSSKKKAKKGQIKYRSKKYQQAVETVEKNQKLPALEAITKVQAGSYSKFEGTIEAHINTNAKNLRGLLNMPFAQGKKLRILAFPSTSSGQVASNLGDGVITGNDQTIAEIEKGKIDFDIVVTSPEWMPKLAKAAKILGPRGLMPNPKNGTISDNLEKAVAELQGGKTEYKTEANGQVIHLSVGKVSQKPEEIVANLKVIYNTVGRSKIQKISLSPTMGPSVKVNLSTLN